MTVEVPHIAIGAISEVISLLVIYRLWTTKRRKGIVFRVIWSVFLLIPLLGLILYFFITVRREFFEQRLAPREIEWPFPVGPPFKNPQKPLKSPSLSERMALRLKTFLRLIGFCPIQSATCRMASALVRFPESCFRNGLTRHFADTTLEKMSDVADNGKGRNNL